MCSWQFRSLSNPSEIAHNEDILRIFLMACEAKTVKLSVIVLSCLQKLISQDAVAPSAFKEILSTLKDHADMTDKSVQLKTLQTILIIFQSHLHPENEMVTFQQPMLRSRGHIFTYQELMERPRSEWRCN
ncbi:uncharacterized protein LOC143887020 [Tasmannia lanceolata]|uniref:uncharacterized protein LOC143887020 n=1 Tax=Tasmannia lanceolata TaxID=3420 RepID=UPI004062D941